MKKILSLLAFIVIVSFTANAQYVSALPATLTFGNTDVVMIVQGGHSYQITKVNLLNGYALLTNPIFVTPNLGTPSVLIGTNITGTAAGFTAGAVTNGVYTTDNLSVMSATTSAQLKGLLNDETGDGLAVFATSPVFTTPNIGVATGSVSGNAGTVTNGVYTTDNLSVMSATTSAQLRGVLSDETGTGLAVFGTSPTFTGTVTIPTPFTLGAVSVTSTGDELNLLDGMVGLTDLDDAVPFLTDVKLFSSLGSGWGYATDTLYFATDNDLGHGFAKVQEDSLEITRIEYYIPASDTLVLDVKYGTVDADGGVTVTGTICSIECDDGLNSITSFDVTTIEAGKYIWLDITGVTLTRKPIILQLDIYGYIKKD